MASDCTCSGDSRALSHLKCNGISDVHEAERPRTGKNKVKLAAEDWSWSAMEWSSFHAQVLLFKINTLTALAVLNSLRSAAAAVEAAN